MSKEFTPAGFDKREVLAGLHLAMGFGTPTRTEDRATFFVPAAAVDTDDDDLAGVPFDPTVRHAANATKVQVACAVEFYDAQGVIETFGSTAPTRIKMTVLDEEYQKIKGYSYVVAGGDKYVRGKTQPPVALGVIDVWTLWADAENER